jgi:hypothetical protein
MCNVLGLAATTQSQISITATSQTVAAVKLASVSPHINTTWSFGASTQVSPVFPVVGAVGNPMIGLLIGVTVDWTDATQFPFVMYNTSHNYLVINQIPYKNAAGVNTNGVDTCMIAIRYE